MSTINALLKKRARLEAQIAEAQRLEKRKAEVLALLEKAGAFNLTDAQILAALTPKAAQPPSTSYANTGATP
ncbi:MULTISPECIES: hypothetical protein [unclassified Thiomonas]|uniref:hypothetical protein n=1 Tax=unclassified Thiomonas TaxID=2625466 RepID=UPI0004DBBBF1|nr:MULTISPECIES: hypothetical protein [unclassified Thiomonas]CDW96332.1 hypothetical protein THICB2_780003 [Thiomonas sp. CB2]VDY06740.1 protein of unknown function [Thiomonas sp. Bio17B3]VDY09966.1 protein of unknown function [Thiomonas sp. Sup16B3]VDY11209.1 protein of unknown function [Thiomonas sp. Sup16B3]VDY11252.1 protein of unknown function [Thiomonas sp. Bio17B3]